MFCCLTGSVQGSSLSALPEHQTPTQAAASHPDTSSSLLPPPTPPRPRQPPDPGSRRPSLKSPVDKEMRTKFVKEFLQLDSGQCRARSDRSIACDDQTASNENARNIPPPHKLPPPCEASVLSTESDQLLDKRRLNDHAKAVRCSEAKSNRVS